MNTARQPSPSPTGLQPADRVQTLNETIFATMSARARTAGAYNLGQGFPDASGPPRVLEIAAEQIAAGNNQYGLPRGDLSLRYAIANQRERDYSTSYDPASEILVTVGATEAITAAVLGLVNPGEEVVVFEPYYDSYGAAIALAGAQRVAVPLKETAEKTWTLDSTAMSKRITDATSMVILNSPHNPTGAVFDQDALGQLAKLCCDHDVIVIADEVYEHLLFDDHSHIPIASLPGMRERTITVSSAAKTFNVTGWKTGWALGPAPLIDAVLSTLR